MPEVKRVSPPYAQVAQHIRDQIHGGVLQPGDMVPSVRELASTWGISKATADKALSALRSEGLVVAVPGVGTQVTRRPPSVQTGGERFRRMLSTGRATRPGERSELKSSELAPAAPGAAAWLRIEEDAPAIRRHRHFVDDDGVAALSTSWLPADLAEAVPGLLQTSPLEGGTIGAVRAATGRQPGETTVKLRSRLATAEEAAALGLELPAAVLVVESELADEDGQPLEFGEDVIPPGRTYAFGADLRLL